MMQFSSAVRSAKGFTIIELTMVMLIVAILTVAAVPGFLDASKRRELVGEANNIALALQSNRSQALSSRSSDQRTIPPGGYGLTVSKIAGALPMQTAYQFVDTWNASLNRAVDIAFEQAAAGNTTQFASRYALPDGAYTDTKDTKIQKIDLHAKPYLSLQSIKLLPIGSADLPANWIEVPDVTVMALPPSGQTLIRNMTPVGGYAAGTDFGTVKFTFSLGGSVATGAAADNTTAEKRIVTLSRVTTSPIISAK